MAAVAVAALAWIVATGSASLENASQVFSILASLATVIALAGVAYSLLMQARANSISAQVGTTERMISLANASLDDGELRACWRSTAIAKGGISDRQRTYTNQIFSSWRMQFQIGVFSARHLRRHLELLFEDSAVARRHWELAREDQKRCGCIESEFSRIVDSAYHHAVPST
jgi:hypothetical protein